MHKYRTTEKVTNKIKIFDTYKEAINYLEGNAPYYHLDEISETGFLIKRYF